MKNQTVERIKENIQSIDYFVDELKEEIEYVDLWRNEYLRRIEKAIEYMKSIEKEPDADMYIEMGEYKEYKHLLNILQGEDNE